MPPDEETKGLRGPLNANQQQNRGAGSPQVSGITAKAGLQQAQQ